jgi:sugar-specific transcriptional regulator TrmB
METRRTFLAGALLVSVSSAVAADLMRAQNPLPNPLPQRPERPDANPSDNEGPALPNADKTLLESNEKDMKKKIDHLFQLATELKEEAAKTDSRKVISLNLVKKAEEIEKLARDIKNRAKG